MRQTTKLTAAVLASAALLAAGCGSDDNGSSDSSGSDAVPPTKAAPAGPVAISMKNIQFNPADQAVKVGETVTWTNDDGVDHDVTAEEGADFKSDTFGQGGTYKFTPKKAGTIKYTCTLHPGMDGTLTVEN